MCLRDTIKVAGYLPRRTTTPRPPALTPGTRGVHTTERALEAITAEAERDIVKKVAMEVANDKRRAAEAELQPGSGAGADPHVSLRDPQQARAVKGEQK